MASDGPVAHLNIIRFAHDRGSPELAHFERAIDAVNAVADRAPGFVWRMKDEDAANPAYDAARVFGISERFGATLSVWATPYALDHFTHQSLHQVYLRRRGEWMLKQEKPSYVIWPISAGHIPTLDEGRDKLAQLTAEGASDAAYDFDYLRARAQAESQG